MFMQKMNRTLSMTFFSAALLFLVGIGGCATLNKEDRALLESTRQSAEEAKAAAARAEAASRRLEDMGVRLDQAAVSAPSTSRAVPWT